MYQLATPFNVRIMLALFRLQPSGRGSVVLVLATRVLGHLLDIHGALRAMVRHTPGVITSVHMG